MKGTAPLRQPKCTCGESIRKAGGSGEQLVSEKITHDPTYLYSSKTYLIYLSPMLTQVGEKSAFASPRHFWHQICCSLRGEEKLNHTDLPQIACQSSFLMLLLPETYIQWIQQYME